MDKNKKKKRGRRPNDISVKFKAELWYLAVKARGNWSDYDLDIEFGYEDESEKHDGIDRLRIFETIRKKRTLPSSGNHPKRNFDLVSRVDMHKNFAGTADIFNSHFWDLISVNPISLDETHKIILSYFDKYGIHRLERSQDAILGIVLDQAGSQQSGITSHLYNSMPQTQRYKIWLEKTVNDLPIDIDLLCFVGSLYREAYLGGELEIALILSDQFVILLEEFVEQPWVKSLDESFLGVVEQRVLHWQSLSDEWTQTYEGHPFDIIPGSLIDKGDPLLTYVLENEDELWSNIVHSIKDLRPKK